MDIDRAILTITNFLERWYPPEIAPHVLKTQLRVVGADEKNIVEKDIRMVLRRLEMVVLPTYMSDEDAHREIIKLKKELGLRY